MIKKLIPKPVKKELKKTLNTLRSIGKTKFFCVGRNKSGTTSVKRAFEDLGFIIGDQHDAERLFDSCFFKNEFKEIVRYCKTAQVFQDVPFSHFEVIPYLDKAYPNSKYILTVRDDAEQWYNSITKYHAKLYGLNGRIPTYEDLSNARYLKKGFLTRLTVDAHGTTPEDPYNKEILINHYEKHNADVIHYFKDRPEDLLVINLSDSNAYHRFIKFVNIDSPYDSFPWENKT